MAKAKPKRRQRPGTAVIQHAIAVQQALVAPTAVQTLRLVPLDHDSMAGQLSHAARELLSMVIALVELGAIFALSWLAGQYAVYLSEHHMATWKVTVFEWIDDIVLVIDVALFTVYFGKRAITKLKKEFQ
jgi:hypothetical protein